MHRLLQLRNSYLHKTIEWVGEIFVIFSFIASSEQNLVVGEFGHSCGIKESSVRIPGYVLEHHIYVKQLLSLTVKHKICYWDAYIFPLRTVIINEKTMDWNLLSYLTSGNGIRQLISCIADPAMNQKDNVVQSSTFSSLLANSWSQSSCTSVWDSIHDLGMTHLDSDRANIIKNK